MNNQEQAYIEGFVKRASEYGFDEHQTVELVKAAGKDIGSLLNSAKSKLKGAISPDENIVRKLLRRLRGTETIEDVLPVRKGLGIAGAAAGGLAGGGISGISSLMNQNFSHDMDEMSPEEKILTHLKRVAKGTVGGAAAGGLAGLGTGAAIAKMPKGKDIRGLMRGLENVKDDISNYDLAGRFKQV